MADIKHSTQLSCSDEPSDVGHYLQLSEPVFPRKT